MSRPGGGSVWYHSQALSTASEWKSERFIEQTIKQIGAIQECGKKRLFIAFMSNLTAAATPKADSRSNTQILKKRRPHLCSRIL
jgi:hypothetical protein